VPTRLPRSTWCLLAAALLAPLPGYVARVDEAEDRAVDFIKKLGGRVVRDDAAPGKPVTRVYLERTTLDDSGLKELAPLKHLQTLDLFNTRVTDEGLKELAPLKSLNELTVNRDRVNDRTLQVLRRIGLLHALMLVNPVEKQRPGGPEDVVHVDLALTQVSDAGLKELALFKNLENLYLPSMKHLTDDGLTHLTSFTKLHTLNLFATRVTDVAPELLAPLKNLRHLNLSYTKLTNAGLKKLGTLQSLETLNIGINKIDDGGLKHLAPLKNLKALNLGSLPTATEAGIMKLQKALPGCKIIR
jgi:internalin A